MWLVAALAWLGTTLVNPLVTDNRPRLDMISSDIDSQI
jgi:hypothetical protein